MRNSSNSRSVNESGGNPRIKAIDSLRGFALAGVCLVHMLEQYFANVAPQAMTQLATAGMVDKIILGINQVFFVGKFYVIFSLLFGVSFFIQINQPASRGEPFKARFLWRLVLLFAFGFIHHFFYRGDILMVYAVLGVLLLPLSALASRYLLIIAVLLFLGLGRIISFSLFSESALFGIPAVSPGSPEFELYYNTLKYGSLTELFSINASGGIPNLLHFQFGMSGRGYITLGLFLVGIVLGRSGFFHNLIDHKALLKRGLLYSLLSIVVAVVLTGLLFSRVEQPITFNRWSEALAFTAADLVNLSISMMTCCAFLLISSGKMGATILSAFAPYGRMALSNYLLQAVIGTAIFFGWGFGKLGELRNIEILGCAISVITLQVFLSRLWMRQFNYGPVEWIWRCATHGRYFPFAVEKTRVNGIQNK